MIFEPVDEEFQPVSPGQASHKVLITNLANHVQPIIRYELGDSITVHPDPSPCGSPLPSVQVIGRTDEILLFHSPERMPIRVLPLALSSVIEEIPGVRRFQAIQTEPTMLSIRLEAKNINEMLSVWQHLKERVQDYLATQGLSNVFIERDTQPPTRDPRSGKFRHVWAELQASKEFRDPVHS